MKVLGLHFGHDAGIALMEDGRVRFLAHAERITGEKKAHGLSYELIADVLGRAQIHPGQIDFCAITSTQGMDIVLDASRPFRILHARHASDTSSSALADMGRLPQYAGKSLYDLLDPTHTLPEAKARREKRVGRIIEKMGYSRENLEVLPAINRGLLRQDTQLGRKSPLRELSDGYSQTFDSLHQYKFDFNFPATVIFEGHEIPAALVSHHAAHAASVFYQSPYETAGIMTLDGGAKFFEGGLFWFGRGKDIVPLRAHYLELGHLYLHMSNYVLRLGGSAEGKMMGLAPYGAPGFFDPRFIGNSWDEHPFASWAEYWLSHIDREIDASPRHVRADLGHPDKMTTPVNADIAASTQKLFEETMLVAVDQLGRLLKAAGMPVDALALSGGCMLNCPTNSRIARESPFHRVFVEPACDDGGLPAGAALWVYHNLMGHPRAATDPVASGLPYYGLPPDPKDLEEALSTYAGEIVVSTPVSLAGEAAQRLAGGQVVGWYEGRSEIGPRALGHRSIVADPRSAATWQRVNTIKGRELWRPLAPSVLAEHSADWFAGLPGASPFMMFVGDVTRPDVPAISHIDGTARVQTVTRECGGYYDLIRRFHEMTGCAVVLNTSMNGPGEPIAEYPSDAIRMLLDGRFDCLALEGRLIERRPAG